MWVFFFWPGHHFQGQWIHQWLIYQTSIRELCRNAHSYLQHLFFSFIKIRASRIEETGWYSMLLMDFHLAHEAQIELWSKYNFSALCPFHVSFRFMFLLTFRMPGAIRSNCLATKLPVLTDSKSPAIPYPTLSLSLYLNSPKETIGQEAKQKGDLA